MIFRVLVMIISLYLVTNLFYFIYIYLDLYNETKSMKIRGFLELSLLLRPLVNKDT